LIIFPGGMADVLPAIIFPIAVLSNHL